MAEGRFYSKDYSSDLSESIIVNETAIKMLGNGYFTGKPFYYVDSYKRLIGVIKDFQHISPLFSAPHPLVFHLRPNGNDYLFVKIDNQKRDIHQITETTNYIKSVCNAFSPNYPLQYSYLNEYTYDREKKIEIRQRIILYATLFAILVSALGLFGLSAFLNEQRTKEIGIRKVTGATLSNLVILLTKDITKLALIANILAWPIAWYVVHQWLQNFAYRVSVGLWIFILAGLAALLISILTVSYQAIHTASVNPVNALRYE
jgi:putative ABC transport system permease protein